MDARRAIPQLESAVRSGDQRVERLERESADFSDQCVELKKQLATATEKARADDRELQRLRSELGTLKGSNSDPNQPLLDAATAGSDGSDVERVPAELYERLKEGLFARDKQIAALERQLAEAPEAASNGVDVAELTEANSALSSEVAAYRATAERLQGEVQELRERNEMVAELAKQRSNRNRELKDSSFALETRLPELEAAADEHQQVVAERDATIERLIAQRDESSAREDTLKARIDALQADLVTLQGETDAEQERVESLRDAVRAADARNEVQRQEVVVLCQSVESFKKTIDERDRTIAMLDHQLNSEPRDSETADAADELGAEREQRIEAMADEISGLRMQIADLEETNAALREGEAEQVRRSAQLEEDLAKAHEAGTNGASNGIRPCPPDQLELADLRADLANREKWLGRLKTSLKERDERIRELELRLAGTD